MFVDASALVAIIAEEVEGPALAARIDAATRRFTAPISLYEATLALLRIRRTTIDVAAGLLDLFAARTGMEIIPITPEIGRFAIDAFLRFGRGNHPARLNMGDCFAYACARSLGVPLLAKGDDFPLTDIPLA
jgi:ribonuclease VapC